MSNPRKTFRETECFGAGRLFLIRVIGARTLDEFRKHLLALRLSRSKKFSGGVRAVPRTARFSRKFAKTRTERGKQRAA